MKINFIIPFISLSGGIKAVFEWANGLISLGHTVNVIYPIIPYYFGNNNFVFSEWINWSYRLIKENIFVVNPNWYDKKMSFTLKGVPLISNIFIPDADITIATAWPTAYSIKKLNSKKGKKLYCVFHYEKEGGNIDKINGSYNLGLQMFTISNRTINVIKREFGKEIKSVIPCGVDVDDFFYDNIKKDWGNILLYYDPSIRKGGDDGIKALKIVLKKINKLKIKIFYGVRKPDFTGSNIEFIKRPISTEALRSLYNESGIFVYPSRFEGFGMPPLEAASCKCAIVTTDVGAIKDYFIDNYSAKIVKPNDIKALANAIIMLAENDLFTNKMAEKSYIASRKFGWENSVVKLNKLLYETIKS
ncbi:MAG: glycosyltransferase family 4 protein [Patescibacteria group bacterium]|nr:glycosyltransferase family 4 protein [Patescibacteria group bacterium]